MKAIIFAAGLGTRLQPLTNHCPKALVKLNEKPLVWYAIQKLVDAGVSEIIINIHHFGEQILEYFSQVHLPVPVYFSDERHVLLDTGGGLLKAKTYLNNADPIIAYNVDVISSVNLRDVLKFHQDKQALATVVVRNRQTSRYLLFNDRMQLTGWKNYTTGEEKISRPDFISSKPLAFSGIQILSPGIYDLITEKGKFSIIDLYLRLAKTEQILGYVDHSDYWIDLGKPGQLEEAEKHLQSDIK